MPDLIRHPLIVRRDPGLRRDGRLRAVRPANLDPGLRRDGRLRAVRPANLDPGLRRDGRLRAVRPYEPATFILSIRIEPTVFAP